MDERTRERLVQSQRNEITEYHIYNKLAEGMDDGENEDVLRRVGEKEKKHYHF